MLYKILTEDKKRAEIAKIVGRYFDGFTMIGGLGYWQGKQEYSLIIEIDTPADHNTSHRIKAICVEINMLNEQQCCLLQVFNPISEFVRK